jgi:purine nucleoside permease
MKGPSDFDRPPPGVSAYDNLLSIAQNGFEISLQNLFLVGPAFIGDILRSWDDVHKTGVKPTNYVGDICGLLGDTPDFGLSPGSC